MKARCLSCGSSAERCLALEEEGNGPCCPDCLHAPGVAYVDMEERLEASTARLTQ
jgi:hypothetical protein